MANTTVLIGEDGILKTKTLYPSVFLSKWDKDTYFRMYSENITSIPQTMLNGYYWYKNGEMHRIYTLTDGSLEYDIIIGKKPDSGLFSIGLDYNDLDFVLQDSLSNTVSNKCCSETYCSCPDEEIYRPESVIYSYAVYSKGKWGNEYGIGKLGHIYRPLVCDNDSHCIYANMSIKDSILTIIVNEKFLNGATYPVTIDPTFGFTSVGGTTSTGQRRRCMNFTLSESGNLQSISFYSNSTSSGNGMRAAIYNQSGSDPYLRVDYNDTTVINYASLAWSNWTFSSTSLTAQNYWLCIASSFDTLSYYYTYDDSNVNTQVYNSSASMPMTWETYPTAGGYIRGVTTWRKLSIYAKYSVTSSSCSAIYSDGYCALPPNCNMSISSFLGGCWT